jgi:hypothetical protein
MWRHHNPGATEWTWCSKLKGGAPERIPARSCVCDCPSLHLRIRSCRYSHEEREAGLLDHSMVIVEVA